MRSRGYRGTTLVGVFLVAMAASAAPMRAGEAQDAAATDRAAATLVPLEVEIVISRYRADTLVSRAPYTLAVNASPGQRGDVAQLNIGADVPVPVTTFTPAGDDNPVARPIVSFNYRHVGTAIECWATIRSNGQYALNVSVDESSVYTDEKPAAPSIVAGSPVFRSYESRNTLLLRNGQSRQYTAATDRVSGEVIRIEATLRVVD